LLKKKHREASKRRKKDKKKMNDMLDSIKKKRTLFYIKKDIQESSTAVQSENAVSSTGAQSSVSSTAAESSVEKQESKDNKNEEIQEFLVTKELLTSGMPCPFKKYEARESLMTKRWVVRPNYDSEEEQKEARNAVSDELIKAYILVMKSLDFNGKANINHRAKDNPWDVICLVTAIDETKYGTHLTINKDEKGVFYFNFKRIGDPLKFNNYWDSVEFPLLHSEYLQDEMDDESDDDEESEEMKTQQVDAVQMDSQEVTAQKEVDVSQVNRVDENAKQENIVGEDAKQEE